MMTYESALNFLYETAWMGSRPGLSRIRALMDRLGHPEAGLQYLHIVGTNGKGSTASMLSSILCAAGYRTGLYTSPYLVDFCERMQLDNVPIAHEALIAAVEAIRPAVEAMDEKPTVFERITAAALWWFAECGCDVVVLEAGMGGEFDATNVIPAKELAIFTNIGLDHTEQLGDTVEKIAATKAGILTPGCAAVLYPNGPGVQAVIEAACEEAGVPLTVADPSRLRVLSADLGGQRLSDGRRIYTLPLLGDHQRRNAAVVLAAVDALRRRGWTIPQAAVTQGLASVSWPGRFELVRHDPPFLLDGGHNPQCIDALCTALTDYLPDTPLTVLTGVLADKDYAAMYERLAPFAARFVCLTPDNPRALLAAALAAHLARYGKPVTVCDSVGQALRDHTAGPTLACGSLYLIGELKARLASRPTP